MVAIARWGLLGLLKVLSRVPLLFVSRSISVRTRASILVYMTLRFVGVQFVRFVVLRCTVGLQGLLNLAQPIPTTLVLPLRKILLLFVAIFFSTGEVS